nr:hypothetical protein [Providencia rettgeri]
MIALVSLLTALLSSLIEKFARENNQEAVNMIAELSPIAYRLSPVAWQHIQLAGNYTFGLKKDNIVLERLLKNLDPLISEESLSLAA